MVTEFQVVPEEGNASSSSSTSKKPKKKQISPSIRWCLRLCNWTEEERSSICSTIQETCRMGIVGKETCPSTGTPHLQGYIEFKDKARPIGVFGLPRVKWIKASKDSTKQHNIIYCSKEDKNAFTHNCVIPKPVKIISEDQLYDWQKDILKVVKTEPDDRTVYWYWSHKGSIGKTCFCKFLYSKYGAYCLNGKGGDVRNGIVEYTKSHGDTPGLIVYPIPRCHGSEYVSYEAIENIKDMFFYSGKYEGGMVCGNSPHLIIFANEPPKETKLSLDRWHIVCIDPENAPMTADMDDDSDSSGDESS